ncbi:uncharacterized protein PAC_15246 [Phialocephala subalpina]|uniref:Uncharacterized protein n=1 Tax=Phialocephala subalpina TaxID=576137 RepID=A0A1L7XK89_9HELO|nr:uncharacterized protein PAC_15246 [Phialocephala subalpina]
MDITNIKDVKDAWAKNHINICLEEIKGINICSVAFDGLYISLVSTTGYQKNSVQYFTILDRDLNNPKSFELFSIDSLEVWHHVCTEQRGLVCGGSDGNIAIVELRDWKPQKQLKALGGLDGEISAMSTRHDLIAAGSTSGEAALWNFAGSKLATIKLDCGTIHSLSIRETRLLVVPDDAYEYEILTPTTATTTPSVPKLKSVGYHKLGETTWAAYNPEQKKIQFERLISTKDQPLERFRPVLPLSSLDYDIHILSCKVKTKRVPGKWNLEIDKQDIVIEEFDSGKTRIIRNFQVAPKHIKSLWCDKERLYWIYTGTSKIMMVNFTDGLSFERNTTVKLAECFSLNSPAYR